MVSCKIYRFSRAILHMLFLIKIDTFWQNRYQIDTKFWKKYILDVQVYKKIPKCEPWYSQDSEISPPSLTGNSATNDCGLRILMLLSSVLWKVRNFHNVGRSSCVTVCEHAFYNCSKKQCQRSTRGAQSSLREPANLVRRKYLIIIKNLINRNTARIRANS